MFIEKEQVRVKISGQDILSTACFSAVKPPVQAALEREHLLFWVLVCSFVPRFYRGYKGGVFIVSGYVIGL